MSLTFKSNVLLPQHFRSSLNTIAPPRAAAFPAIDFASSHPCLPLWNYHGGPLLMLAAKTMSDKATSENCRLVNRILAVA